jgi:hypothetical protein
MREDTDGLTGINILCSFALMQKNQKIKAA